MALNGQDKAWIGQEIADSHRKHGGAKIAAWFKDWGALAVMLVIAGAVLSQWTTYIEFRTQTRDRLDSIDSQLRSLSASTSPKKVLSQLATLNADTLSKNLEALRKVSEQPISAVSPGNLELNEIRSNLSKVNETTSEYWPTTLQFIEFASTHYGSRAPERNDGRGFVSNVSGVNMSGSTLELSGSVSNSVFTNSRIIFTDKPTIVRNVRFVNCIFVFENLDNPTPEMEQIGRRLLATGVEMAIVSTG